MTNSTRITHLAHAAAAQVLAGWSLSFPMTDHVGCGRVACACDGIEPESADGQLYIERFAGHVINVQCGTSGL